MNNFFVFTLYIDGSKFNMKKEDRLTPHRVRQRMLLQATLPRFHLIPTRRFQ